MDAHDTAPMTSVDVTEEVAVAVWERPHWVVLYVTDDNGMAAAYLTPDQARAIAAALMDAANNLEAGAIVLA
jgi:hypothetical protein